MGINQRAVELVLSGAKLQAIKLLREEKGMTLVQAKYYLEALLDPKSVVKPAAVNKIVIEHGA